MAIAVTVTAGMDDFSFKHLSSRNVCMVAGTFAYDSASSTALTISGADLGLSRIDALFVSNKTPCMFGVASVSAAEWTVQPLSAISSVSTTLCVLMATASLVIASTTGIPFFAFGQR